MLGDTCDTSFASMSAAPQTQRRQRRRLFHRFQAVVRHAHDLHVRRGFDHGSDGAPHERRVIHHKHTNCMIGRQHSYVREEQNPRSILRPALRLTLPL